MTYDPFEEVTPLSPISDWEVLTSTLNRSMMWDLIGPHKIKTNPEKLGINSASDDVLNAEYAEMLNRRQAISPVRAEVSLLSYVAAQVASDTILALDDKFSEISSEDELSFRAHTVNMGAAIADAVIGHMFQQGLIHYGRHE